MRTFSGKHLIVGRHLADKCQRLSIGYSILDVEYWLVLITDGKRLAIRHGRQFSIGRCHLAGNSQQGAQ